MKYWLLKSEPNVWSIDQQKKAGAKGVAWEGVRNYQAANNLKKMKKTLGRLAAENPGKKPLRRPRIRKKTLKKQCS